MLYYQLIITAIISVLLLMVAWNLVILRKRHYSELPGNELPFVSVLVPARNEELNIRKCVTSLLNQDYSNYELIVLNDNSEDSTGSILNDICSEHPNLKIINGKVLPEGWTGKCYACKQLSDTANGEYILFTDSDTVHHPNSIRDAVRLAVNRKSDMLTVFPRLEMKTFPEKLIMPMLYFTIVTLMPFYFVDRTGKWMDKFSLGIGPFMLFRRKAYDLIGGHEDVKNAIVEDVWLARSIKKRGLNLSVAHGLDMLVVRMYRNFNEIWNGFSKNIFPGFNYSSVSLFTVMAFYICLFFLPFIFLIAQLSSLEFDLIFRLLLAQTSCIYVIRIMLSIRYRLGFVSTFLHPAGALLVPVIALNSWRWAVSGKGSKWKGRSYKPKKIR